MLGGVIQCIRLSAKSQTEKSPPPPGEPNCMINVKGLELKYVSDCQQRHSAEVSVSLNIRIWTKIILAVNNLQYITIL